jgi:hypothetical protein
MASYQATGLKAASVGASAYGIMSMVGPDADVRLPGGSTVSLPVFAAGASAVGSVVSDLAHNYIFSFLPLDQKYENTEAMAVSAGVSVGSFYAVSAAVSSALPAQIGMVEIAGTALLSNAIGDYVYMTVLAPMFV